MIKTGLVWSSTSSVRPGTRANLFVTGIAPASRSASLIFVVASTAVSPSGR